MRKLSPWILSAITAAAVGSTLVSSTYAREVKPGIERWPIKTSLPDNPAAKTVVFSDLIALPDPPDVTKNDRRYQEERISAFQNQLGVKEGDLATTSGWLHLVAGESDGDYHIQISASPDSGDNCLVVEVPNPGEEFVLATTLRPKFEQVRDFIKTNLLHGREPSATGSVLKHPAYVKITGQLFYDDSHVGDPPRGKKGMHAATLWELHPVTDIAFARPPVAAHP